MIRVVRLPTVILTVPPIPFVKVWVLDAQDGLDLVVGLGSAWGRVLAQFLARC